MRVNADNTLKLAKNERRLGNFVIKDEDNHVKVMDINQIFTHRASKSTPIGQYLKISYDALASGESDGRGLKNWLTVIFTAFSTIPDLTFLENVFKECEGCMMRHPEVYGSPKEPVSDERDAEIIQEEKELVQFEEEVRALPDVPESPGEVMKG